MVIIGVDPHQRTHTASALEPGSHRVLATVQTDASPAGYRRLLRWAAAFASRRWAVENARGLGRHLAQWLVARGEFVQDVPSTATARGCGSCRGVAGARTMSSDPEGPLQSRRLGSSARSARVPSW
jgi:hypothetical protein